jgi:hypothetical protein
MIELHWSVLFAIGGVGSLFGFFCAAALAASGHASRCEDCAERTRMFLDPSGRGDKS